MLGVGQPCMPKERSSCLACVGIDALHASPIANGGRHRSASFAAALIARPRCRRLSRPPVAPRAAIESGWIVGPPEAPANQTDDLTLAVEGQVASPRLPAWRPSRRVSDRVLVFFVADTDTVIAAFFVRPVGEAPEARTPSGAPHR